MRKPLDTAPTVGRGSVSAGEVYTLREAARRLGWAAKLTCDAQKAGLQTVFFGRSKYVTGQAILDFFRRLAEQQAGNSKQ
jgi:hypothetical protein